MPNLAPEYKWPDSDKRRLIGKRHNRIDGVAKSSGAARYTFDINRPGLLWAKVLISPHAHAKIKKIDTSAAEAMPGVKGVEIIQGEGAELQYHGDDILMIAADSEERAGDAVRAVKVDYEVLPFVIDDTNPKSAAPETKEAKDEAKFDEDAFKGDDVVTVEGKYGIAVITHCCLEPHGMCVEWTGEDALTLWISTQNVSGVGGDLANNLKIPAANVQLICEYMGGGFGSKFNADRWGVAVAKLAKKTGKPVKCMLERDHELLGAGNRPSGFANVKVAAKKDGTIVAWDSYLTSTGGPGTGGILSVGQVPYVFRGMPRRSRAMPISTNTGPQRAWRAPNHPQAAALTMTALADLAAAVHMDELEFFRKNLKLVQSGFGGQAPDVYAQELALAADLIGWKKLAHPRGDKTAGPIKRGLGISMHTWGGGPSPGNVDLTVNPDGSVVLQAGSQDLGTGTRTVFALVAAETLGLEVKDIKVEIGSSKFVAANPSGGSITVGSISSTTRRASLEALEEIFAAAAPALGAEPGDLEVDVGKIRVKGKPDKNLTWKQACAKLDMKPIKVTGKQPAQNKGNLASPGVCGVQMADVSVDVETGIVRMNKFVAVQDCGLIINLKCAESQVHGAVIQGVCYGLYEERICDPITGRVLNPDMEFYKLAGIGDVGEIVVHMMQGKHKGPGADGKEVEIDYDAKGVVGLGEPPVISPGAAIANAVANAIGVRVPTLPHTADRVLAALEKKGGNA